MATTVVAAAAGILLFNCASPAAADPMHKILLQNSKALDGSPALYYLQTADPVSPNADKWVVFLEGGGICQAQGDCHSRKASVLGSSTIWSDTYTCTEDQDILSDDPARNPDIADWRVHARDILSRLQCCCAHSVPVIRHRNHVFIPYVSGDVWSGMQSTPFNPWCASLSTILSLLSEHKKQHEKQHKSFLLSLLVACHFVARSLHVSLQPASPPPQSDCQLRAGVPGMQEH